MSERMQARRSTPKQNSDIDPARRRSSRANQQGTNLQDDNVERLQMPDGSDERADFTRFAFPSESENSTQGLSNDNTDNSNGEASGEIISLSQQAIALSAKIPPEETEGKKIFGWLFKEPTLRRVEVLVGPLLLPSITWRLLADRINYIVSKGKAQRDGGSRNYLAQEDYKRLDTSFTNAKNAVEKIQGATANNIQKIVIDILHSSIILADVINSIIDHYGPIGIAQNNSRPIPEEQVQSTITPLQDRTFNSREVGSFAMTGGFMEPSGHGRKDRHLYAIFSAQPNSYQTIPPISYGNVGIDYDVNVTEQGERPAQTNNDTKNWYPGTVTYANTRYGYGYRVEILSDVKYYFDGIYHDVYQGYAHLNSIAPGIVEGKKIPRGTVVGQMGTTSAAGDRGEPIYGAYPIHVDFNLWINYEGKEISVSQNLMEQQLTNQIGYEKIETDDLESNKDALSN